MHNLHIYYTYVYFKLFSAFVEEVWSLHELIHIEEWIKQLVIFASWEVQGYYKGFYWSFMVILSQFRYILIITIIIKRRTVEILFSTPLGIKFLLKCFLSALLFLHLKLYINKYLKKMIKRRFSFFLSHNRYPKK